ncbi:hypothetical protein MD484_g8235, partial [Candolleomyces efflorescens]
MSVKLPEPFTRKHNGTERIEFNPEDLKLELVSIDSRRRLHDQVQYTLIKP